MLDSHTPNRESGPPGPVGGRLAMRSVQDLTGGARALIPPEQGVGNGPLDPARLSTDGPAFGIGRAHRPASPDPGRRRRTLLRVARRVVNPSLPRASVEQGGHTDPQPRRNEYIYCAATSHPVPSATNPHSDAGSEGERGSTGRPAPTDPTRCRGLVSDARGGTHPTRQNRADGSTRARHRRWTPSPHTQAACGGAGRRANPSSGAAPASATERRRPGWDGPSRKATAGEVPARMRMTAHTGLATERPPARGRSASTHRGEVQFDDRTATHGLQKGGNPRGSR